MGQTSAKLTWPVRTHAGAGMIGMTSPVNTRNVTGTYGPAYTYLFYRRSGHQPVQ